jgi:hypothetical protein
LVEQSIRNRQVIGSSPIVGSTFVAASRHSQPNMKIILSRKGFDSKNGEVASPIFSAGDGELRLFSLPIPLAQATCEYQDISWSEGNVRELIAALRGNKRKPLPNTPHLDPDLHHGALNHRHPGWRPIFGQNSGPESQLQKAGVAHPMDPANRPLFLFFGWYREIQHTQIGYRYRHGAPDLHAFFGWLQVERKIILTGSSSREAVIRAMPWAASHPHVACSYYDKGKNAIYVAPQPGSASDQLILNGRKTGLPASGTFRRFVPEVHTLTMKGKSRRYWRVPYWFYRNGEPGLGMHGKRTRWAAIPNDSEHIQLQSVDIGQEFVFDSTEHEEEKVFTWIESIIQAGQPLAKSATNS